MEQSTPFNIVFETRYSFFGQSGWSSTTSTDPDALFDPARLARRFDLFTKMALPSLRDQTDQDFKLVVLTSQLMPDWHLRELTEACNAFLGAERVHIIPRPAGSAGRWLRKFIARNLNDTPYTAQVVLDDDDAVAQDFVEILRRDAAFAISNFQSPDDHAYLSYARGLTAKFDGDAPIDLARRVVPFTNLGLTLVAPTKAQKNPYMLAHKKVARRHNVIVNYAQRPFYIRAVHDFNDSRAHRKSENLAQDGVETARGYFPLLNHLSLAIDQQPVFENAA